MDLSSERREFVRDLYPSITVSDEVENIINDKDIHAVIIATPVSTHFDLAKKCLQSGKHVLVEKPMASTNMQVNQIGKIAKKK